MNEEQYFERFREVEARHKADIANLAQKSRGIPDGKKLREIGPALAVAYVTELRLEKLRQKHYQQALDELRDIETSTKQGMNHLRR